MDKVLIGNYLNQIEYYAGKIRAELCKVEPVVMNVPDIELAERFDKYREIHDMTTRPLIANTSEKLFCANCGLEIKCLGNNLYVHEWSDAVYCEHPTPDDGYPVYASLVRTEFMNIPKRELKLHTDLIIQKNRTRSF